MLFQMHNDTGLWESDIQRRSGTRPKEVVHIKRNDYPPKMKNVIIYRCN